ncbi:MAG: hypothetical protein M1831_002683 [Alyxoria varia]|nr:MAG: hypothetical protein M1831_002683 [Alyxoria varia]
MVATFCGICTAGTLSRTAFSTKLSRLPGSTIVPTISKATMSYLSTRLKAPNGHEYSQPTGLFIANEWRPSKSGTTITSVNPTDEADITSVHSAGPEDVDDAVAVARKAFKSSEWRDMAPTDRGNLMIKLAELVERDAQTLATIETWDNGKPYQVALEEDVAEVAGTFRYYGGYADKIHGQVIDVGPAKHAYTIREPIGVCGQIIPYVVPVISIHG